MKMYYDADVDTDALEGKTIAVISYGSQGRAQSRNMADSGANVIVGLRENGSSWNVAKEDGMTVKSIEDASAEADIIHILLPDEIQEKVYNEQIAQYEKMGYKGLAVCMAKTPNSITDDAKVLGAPTGFTITVREVRLSAGAGFIVPLTGAVMTMPGPPKVPAATKM